MTALREQDEDEAVIFRLMILYLAKEEEVVDPLAT